MKNQFQMGIEIKTKSGTVLRPSQLSFWDAKAKESPAHLSQVSPQTPLKYYTDAILGLCFHNMNDYKFLSPEEKQFALQAYRTLDSYTEIYRKSAPRVKSLRKKGVVEAILVENFEKKLTDIWSTTFCEKTVSLEPLAEALECIHEFEHRMKIPLLYNFHLEFSEKFTQKLTCFYSFLFHLRALVAVDHNGHVSDTAFEAVKCDSISDYLPKSDYTVNDALLYWQFKRLTLPFTGHKDKDPRIEKLMVEPMSKFFNQYNHNACCLIDQLPKSFLSSMAPTDLEEALHHVQMDWLLGSESGLLFKIREELYGLTEGYEKIFWPETATSIRKQGLSLNLCFFLNEKDLSKESSAA